MKKTLILTITALTLVTLVGCGAKNTDANTNNTDANNTPIVNSQSSGISDNVQNIVVTPYTGKVEKVVGNELTMKLAKDQGLMTGAPGTDVDGNNPARSEIIMIDDGTLNPEGGIQVGGGSSEGGELPELSSNVTEVEVGGMGVVNAADGTVEESNFSDLEYTDESKDFTIPAGAEIFNMKRGKMGKLSDIKENSILMIMTDSKTGTITSINIME